MTNLIIPVINSTVVCCAVNHILQNDDVCMLIVVYNYEAADVTSGRVPASVDALWGRVASRRVCRVSIAVAAICITFRNKHTHEFCKLHNPFVPTRMVIFDELPEKVCVCSATKWYLKTG